MNIRGMQASGSFHGQPATWECRAGQTLEIKNSSVIGDQVVKADGLVEQFIQDAVEYNGGSNVIASLNDPGVLRFLKSGDRSGLGANWQEGRNGCFMRAEKMRTRSQEDMDHRIWHYGYKGETTQQLRVTTNDKGEKEVELLTSAGTLNPCGSRDCDNYIGHTAKGILKKGKVVVTEETLSLTFTNNKNHEFMAEWFLS